MSVSRKLFACVTWYFIRFDLGSGEVVARTSQLLQVGHNYTLTVNRSVIMLCIVHLCFICLLYTEMKEAVV